MKGVTVMIRNSFLSRGFSMLVALGLCLFFFELPAAYGQQIQRMRLPAGSYYIEGVGGGQNTYVRGGGVGGQGVFGSQVDSSGGGGVPNSSQLTSDSVARLPARCIDGSSLPPFDETSFSGAGEDIEVQQIEGGRIIDKRSLEEATSVTDPWIEFSGFKRSTHEIEVKIKKPGYDYILQAPNGAIFSDDADIAHQTEESIRENAALSYALKRLDRFEGDLRSNSSPDDAITSLFLEVKQDLEWHYFKGSREETGIIETIKPDDDLVERILEGFDSRDHSVASALENLLKLDPFIKSELPNFVYLHLARGMTLGNAITSFTHNLAPDDLWLISDPYLYFMYHFDRNYDIDFDNTDSIFMLELIARFYKEVIFTLTNLQENDIASDRYVIVSNAIKGYIMYGFDSDGKGKFHKFSEIPTKDDAIDAGFDPSQYELFLSNDPTILKNLELRGFPASGLDKTFQSLRKKAYQEEQTENGISLSRDNNSLTKIEYNNLDVNGDNLIIETPVDAENGRDMIVIDTGNSGPKFLEIVKEKCRRRGERICTLRLVVTHTDADHIRGLMALLVEPDIVVQEVLIGRSIDKLSKIAEDIFSHLKANYEEVSTNESSLVHYVKAGINPAVAHDKDWKGLNRLHVKSKSAEIDLFQLKDPQKSNDSGLIVRVREAGTTQLLTDDATDHSIAALLDAFEESGELSAGVLKWPHHIWYPERSDSKLDILKKLVQMTNPHTVILTNRGSKQPESNVEKIIDFIEDNFGKNIRIFWTRDKGSIKISRLLGRSSIPHSKYHSLSIGLDTFTPHVIGSHNNNDYITVT
jgi:beta-lactamase superfamily II metal-dependent hydrolase